jgi:hypothetical protein
MSDKIITVTTVHSVGMKGAGVAGPFCEPSLSNVEADIGLSVLLRCGA